MILGEVVVHHDSHSQRVLIVPDVLLRSLWHAACQEEQAGVTVPFYFICVLHLANEKGLRLEGRPDMTDFSVARDDSSAARP